MGCEPESAMRRIVLSYVFDVGAHSYARHLRGRTQYIAHVVFLRIDYIYKCQTHTVLSCPFLLVSPTQKYNHKENDERCKVLVVIMLVVIIVIM